MPGGVAAAFGVGRFRKNFANGVESFQVRGGVRTRRAPDGRLIHNHHLTDVRIALEAVAKFLNAPANALGILPRSESTRLNSSHVAISYAVFCLKKKNQ